MKTITVRVLFTGFVVAAGLVPLTGFAQSRSAGLGATNLDGLKPFTDCLERVKGHREQLIAARLDAKLAVSTALNAQERAAWQRDISALRAVTPQQPNFVPPDAKDAVHYLSGLTDAEQVSINSMTSRHSQEINLECEQKYGGMTRYSPGSDQSGQRRFEDQLRADMVTATDIATIAVTALPSPFPKSQEQVAAEQRAVREAQRAEQNRVAQLAIEGAVARSAARSADCQQEVKGLQMTIQADYMQRALDAAQGLSAQQRSEFEADIRATREAAASGLQMAVPIDPSNPMRAMMRLTPEQQVAAATEYGQKMAQQFTACQTR
jgi:hypothetical protein